MLSSSIMGKKLQMRQMKYKDDRIKLMNEILSGIKVLKLYAWEKSFEKQISDIREKELKILKKTAYVTAFTGFLWSCVPFVVALIIFTTYVLADDNNILTPDKAFVALSLINIMRFPMSIFPMLISALIMSSVSIKRINAFMNSEELDSSAINSDKSFADPIIVENGSFDWDGTESINPTLHNINMRVKTGALVAVVGSVGTGKSSLISALLGELSKLSGLVNIKGTIAYVPQQAWLQNATLRENILFGKTYDARKYAKIIKHCALEQDLDMLPGGDMTEIGEKGINLSGGQKQRVSLARAVYNDTDIYFLDDPLSAVDSHVGKHIFENVIGPKGTLKNKTRILVTHAVTYLPEVDLILVMNDGTISESGTYQELLAKKGEFAEFLFQYMKERNDDVDSEGIEDLKKQLLEHKEDLPLNLSRELSRQCSSTSEQRLHRTISVESKNSDHKNSSVNNLLKKGKEDKLIQSESLEIGKVNWNVYKYYIKAVGTRVAMMFMLLTALYQVFSVAGNAWLSVWSTDVVTPSNTTNNSSNQTFYLEVYGILGIGQILAKLLSQLSAAAGGVYAARYIQKKMLIRVLHSPMSFFDTTPLGRIMNRFSKDIDTVDNTLPTCLQMVLNFCAMLASTICVITFTTPIFIFVIIPVIILNFSIQRFYVKTARQMQRLESVSKSPVYSHFSESLSGVQTLRAYKVQKAFINQCEKNVDRNLSCFYLAASSNRWVSVRLESLGNLLVFSAAIFAVLAKDMSPGLVGLSLTYALQITTMLFMLVREATNLETNTVSVERIKEYSELNEEAPWELEPKPDPRWPIKGSIEFKDYAVSYRKGLDPVLKGVSFKVKSGEKVGIVGQTGAGKSSLTMALFRILEATRGQITIDDCDISKIGLHDLRSRLTIIPQDPILFSGTLRINLDPFGEQKDDSIWYALELANLKNFVKGLPAGLQHQMSEGGENLSVGQRQLICLARALLRRSKILVLDEATAAVDLETDDVIQQTIRLVFKESTVLTIAHRLNTIMDYDRVLVIDKGLVVEFDSPKNLLSKNTSKFYQLAKDAGIVQ
uniref:ABC-type glutathione-S-conjugate transporter n=1 Tax=Clastoptera arizonana TaxID=38151 RepID=A0A1B6CN72_9HEMI